MGIIANFISVFLSIIIYSFLYPVEMENFLTSKKILRLRNNETGGKTEENLSVVFFVFPFEDQKAEQCHPHTTEEYYGCHTSDVHFIP